MNPEVIVAHVAAAVIVVIAAVTVVVAVARVAEAIVIAAPVVMAVIAAATVVAPAAAAKPMCRTSSRIDPAYSQEIGGRAQSRPLFFCVPQVHRLCHNLIR